MSYFLYWSRYYWILQNIWIVHYLLPLKYIFFMIIFCHMKIKKAVRPFYQKYFWQKINVRNPMGVLHSFSIKNNFCDKTFFYFSVTICMEGTLVFLVLVFMRERSVGLDGLAHFWPVFLCFLPGIHRKTKGFPKVG